MADWDNNIKSAFHMDVANSSAGDPNLSPMPTTSLGEWESAFNFDSSDEDTANERPRETNPVELNTVQAYNLHTYIHN